MDIRLNTGVLATELVEQRHEDSGERRFRPNGAHLHMSVADPRGQVSGGHVARGCMIRTTAEILLVLLPEYRFSRERDPGSGFMELVIQNELPTDHAHPTRPDSIDK